MPEPDSHPLWPRRNPAADSRVVPAMPADDAPLPAPAAPAAVSQAAPAAGEPDADDQPGSSLAIWALVGLIVFLIALTLVVLVARQLRPAVALLQGRSSPKSAAARIEQLVSGTTEESQQQAAEEIAALGPESVLDALDVTTAISLERNTYKCPKSVVQAFAALGTPLVDVLVQGLRSDKENVRTVAAEILRSMGDKAAPAVPDLAPLVNQPNRWLRSFACDALGNAGPAAAAAIGPLIAAVGHEDPYTRRRAVVALGRIGPQAQAALPALEKAKHEDFKQEIREAANLAIYQIDLARIAAKDILRAPPDVRELVAKLNGNDEYQAVAAARALGSRAAPDAVTSLALALRSKNKWIREAAAEALAPMGSHTENILPILQQAAADPEREVREAAERTLARLAKP